MRTKSRLLKLLLIQICWITFAVPNVVYARYYEDAYEGGGDWILFIATIIFWIIILFILHLFRLSEEKIDSSILKLSKFMGTILGLNIFFRASDAGSIVGGIIGGIFSGFFSYYMLGVIGNVVSAFMTKNK